MIALVTGCAGFIGSHLVDHHNKTIEVYGDGTQTRDFTYVSDVIQANLLAAESKSKVNGEVFNIGGGSRISVKGLIELIESTTGKIAKVTYFDKQKGDVRHTYADISKAKHNLGYKPEVTIEDGIKKYVDWLVNNK